MFTTYTGPLDRLDGALDELAAISPEFRATDEKQEVLVGLSRFIARAQAEQLCVLASAGDVAEATGDRPTATWLATQTRDAHGRLRRDAALAVALDQRWIQTAAAFAAGELNLAQARVIAEALDALPKDLGDDLRVKAEAHLVAEAAQFGPRDLAALGGRVLEVIAPDLAEQSEYQRLLAAERRASAATRLVMRPRGDGSADLHARVPDQVLGRLRAYLNAFTAPRRRHLHDTVETPFGPLTPPAEDEFANLPIARQRGEAFVALLENIPTKHLPRHGGTATSVMVTIDYDTLVADLTAAGIAAGIAETSTGHRITAGQARRLACQADILPAVLGGNSEILDLGRESRLFKPPQRKAMNARDKTCTTIGCSVPAEFCEAHHEVPWSEGGNTDLKDGKLLCPFHHHRAHDPAWNVNHHPNGKTSFTRRQ
jgi:hypothetical protein